MSRSDPLLMLADIARLAFEHPDVDEALVRAIYQHQVLTTGRQPTLRQAREYIGHLTSHLDDATIRVTLGLPPAAKRPQPSRPRPPARARARPGRPVDSRAVLGPLPRRVGRAVPPYTMPRSPRTSRCSTASSAPSPTTCASS